MSPSRAPRFRVSVYQLHEGKTTQVIDAYGSGFITAVATLDGGPRELQQHIAAAIAHEYGPPR